MGVPLGGELGLKVNVIVKSGRARVVFVLKVAGVVWLDSLWLAERGLVTEVSVPPWLWVVVEEGEAMVFILRTQLRTLTTCRRFAAAH